MGRSLEVSRKSENLPVVGSSFLIVFSRAGTLYLLRLFKLLLNIFQRR